MPEWGTAAWGVSTYEGLITPVIPVGATGPSIIQRVPAPQQQGVSDTAVIAVTGYAPANTLDAAATSISVNGAVAYSGATGFAPEFVGRVHVQSGAQTIFLSRILGWGYGATVTVRATFSDTLAQSTEDTWSWSTRENDVCYSGRNPLPIETELLQPFQVFLELEPARLALLRNALKVQASAIPDRDAKAARAVYQLAFATEASVAINKYHLRNEAALATRVCERNRYVELERLLLTQDIRLLPALQSLKTQGVIPEEVRVSLQDYTESASYLYRTSVVAILVLLAKGEEIRLRNA